MWDADCVYYGLKYRIQLDNVALLGNRKTFIMVFF